jgi:hypothetical protein
MLDVILDALIDALVDTAKLLPFLYVTYLAMEALEHGTSGRAQEVVARAGKAGPVIGALLGAIPQCGFSAMAATLFSGGVVSMGTLVAVILSTSDEMVPVFLANRTAIPTMGSVMLLKVIVGAVVGLTLDAALRSMGKGEPHEHIHDLCERAHCSCGGPVAEAAADDAEGEGGAHSHGGRGVLRSSARAALVHTVQTGLFILVISFGLGLVVELVGNDVIAAVLGRHPVRSVLLAGLVGLIPNCGASVALSQLYLDGSLSIGALVAGLLDAGGTGLLVLYRENRNVRQNLVITALLYAVGVACGLAVAFSGVSL